MEGFEKDVTELFCEMGKGQGINDFLLMKLFAKLYLSSEPIAMEDLAKETGYSLASVSNKTRMLGPLFNIRKIKKPGSKKIYLYMDKDILSLLKRVLIMKEEQVVKKAKEKIPLILKEHRRKAKSYKDKEKIRIMEGYHEQILKFEKILKRILIEIEKPL